MLQQGWLLKLHCHPSQSLRLCLLCTCSTTTCHLTLQPDVLHSPTAVVLPTPVAFRDQSSAAEGVSGRSACTEGSSTVARQLNGQQRPWLLPLVHACLVIVPNSRIQSMLTTSGPRQRSWLSTSHLLPSCLPQLACCWPARTSTAALCTQARTLLV